MKNRLRAIALVPAAALLAGGIGLAGTTAVSADTGTDGASITESVLARAGQIWRPRAEGLDGASLNGGDVQARSAGQHFKAR